MKIALLTTDSREHFKDYGAANPYFGTAPEALLQGFTSLKDVEVHVLSCARARLKSPENLASNVFFHSLHVPKLGWMSTFYQGCVRAFQRALQEIQPDIVHGQGTEKDNAMGAVFSGFPNVLTIHGNMAELARLFPPRIGSHNWFAARLETFSLKRTRGVFCNSEYTEQLVRRRTVRTWRVPNAIREPFFAPLNVVRRNGKPILLNVGVVSPRKQQLELLGVVQELRKQGLEFEFHFIGQADPTTAYAAEFLEKIKPLEKEGVARYLGTKNTGELIQYFDSADALVHFPLEEAFGLVVAESLARDLKFFGAKTGGIIDIAFGMPGATLVEPKNRTGLAVAIGNWIREGSPRSVGANRVVRERYHPVVVADRHVEIYKEVLGG